MDYNEFREQYEQQHPASVPALNYDTQEYPPWLQPITLVMFVAVSVVSGAHTVSTVRQTLEASLILDQSKDLIAFAAFFGFELALFVSVFSWLRSQARWLSYASTAVVFVVIVLANVQDVARSFDASSLFTTLIVAGVGVGTPLVALLSGKLFVDIYRANKVSGKRALETYQEALRQWDAVINRAYTKSEKTSVSLPIQAAIVETPHLESHGKLPEITGNYRKDATEIVRKFFNDNPEAFQRSNRDIAHELGVSHPVVGNVKKEFANGTGYDLD